MFDRDELGSIYNCVSFVIGERERANELTSLFEDRPTVDPIIDRLYALEQKLIQLIDENDANEVSH